MRILRRALALAAAAVTATAVTTVLAALFVDWRRGVLAARFGWDIVEGPYVAILFGFVGMLLFLGCTLPFAYRSGVRRFWLALIGAATGLMHTLAGAAFLIAFGAIDAPIGSFLDKAEIAAGFVFGFVLVGQAAAGGWLPALAGFSAVGGACSGWVYAAVRGRRRHSSARAAGSGHLPANAPN